MTTEQKVSSGVGRQVLRGVLVLLVFVLILASTGIVYQAIESAQDRHALPPPGQLIDVGGYRLHLHVTGTPQEAPTVLLDAGGASMSSQWGWIQPSLANDTQVVSYDRPGMGYSETPPTSRDVHSLIADLRTALDKSGVRGPYLLVGHSMSALFVRAFAKLYPEEVAGIVLMDPRYLSADDTVPESERKSDSPAGFERLMPLIEQQLPLVARLGLFRLMNIAGEYVSQLPPEDAARARAMFASTHHWQGVVSDTQLGDNAEALLRQGESLSDTPLLVLSADQTDSLSFADPAQRSAFTALHDYMAATLSEKGEHITITGADHVSITMNQAYARRVTEHIHRLLQTLTPE